MRHSKSEAKEMHWQTSNSSNTVRHQRVIFFSRPSGNSGDKILEVLTANRKSILIRALLLYLCAHQPPPPKKKGLEYLQGLC